jgi:hypothetical protein
MRYILIVYTILFSMNALGQNKFEFTKIDSIPASKNELYIRAKTWMSNFYRSSKSVIEMDDKDAGRIIGKAVIPWEYVFLHEGCTTYIHYTITIDVRENKVRLVLSDFYHEGCKKIIRNGDVGISDGGSLNQDEEPWRYAMKKRKQKWWDDIKATAKSKAESLMYSFGEEMRKSINKSEDF